MTHHGSVVFCHGIIVVRWSQMMDCVGEKKSKRISQWCPVFVYCTTEMGSTTHGHSNRNLGTNRNRLEIHFDRVRVTLKSCRALYKSHVVLSIQLIVCLAGEKEERGGCIRVRRNILEHMAQCTVHTKTNRFSYQLWKVLHLCLLRHPRIHHRPSFYTIWQYVPYAQDEQYAPGRTPHNKI